MIFWHCGRCVSNTLLGRLKDHGVPLATAFVFCAIPALVNGVNTNTTNITATVSEYILSPSWPADQTSWRLLEQTNNLVVGISANTNDWMTVPGLSTIYSTNITINHALPAEFYRLVYP